MHPSPASALIQSDGHGRGQDALEADLGGGGLVISEVKHGRQSRELMGTRDPAAAEGPGGSEGSESSGGSQDSQKFEDPRRARHSGECVHSGDFACSRGT